MDIKIACVDGCNEIFYAHDINLNKKKSISIYGCGICLYGKIFLNLKTNNLNKNYCGGCGCQFVIEYGMYSVDAYKCPVENPASGPL